VKLSVQDKLALMLTSAGSQRRLGDFIGVSHQRVGRWLREGQEGGTKRPPSDPAILDAINQAFAIHTEVSRDQARKDHLHFDAKAPVFAARLWKQKTERVRTPEGETVYRPVVDRQGRPVMHPGDRVAIEHTHWLRDSLRTHLVTAAQKSGKYLHASIGSLVNLQVYRSRADARFRAQGMRRTESQRAHREQMNRKLQLGEQSGWVFTPYIPTPANVASDVITDRMSDLLRERHEPATGTPGTALGAQILLQVDNRDATPPAAKPRKPRKR
jgi:hypothetical protein